MNETTTVLSGMAISHSYMVDGAGETTRMVPKVSLDDYFAANPIEGPYFLKIDIDGEELKVLQGATETLKQASVVMMEVIIYGFAERIGFLLEHGFQLFDLTEPAYYDDSFWQCDAVFVRRDIHAAYFQELTENLDQSKYTVFGN